METQTNNCICQPLFQYCEAVGSALRVHSVTDTGDKAQTSSAAAWVQMEPFNPCTCDNTNVCTVFFGLGCCWKLSLFPFTKCLFHYDNNVKAFARK